MIENVGELGRKLTHELSNDKLFIGLETLKKLLTAFIVRIINIYLNGHWLNDGSRKFLPFF